MPTPSTAYATPARLFHWTMAVLLLATIPVGFLMIQEGLGRSLQNTLFIFHKNVGVLILGLAILRLGYRWARPAPPLPTTLPAWQVRAAGASHAALYGLMIAMPVAGYVRVVAGGFPIEVLDAAGMPPLVPESEALAEAAKTAHHYGAYLITALVGVHVLAALHHGLVRRDGVISRIWPPIRPRRR
ncbi:cytochrome b [Rhodosalinus sp.]|uniref:cytochrome b n=1 Tax=Rhodosalinus sp. TaxID=2047741 RepID=UPI00356A0600